MDYAPEDPTPAPVPGSSSPPDAAVGPNYAPSVDDLLKDIPKFPPLPKWDDPELRYMPKTSAGGQPPVTPDEAWQKIYNLVEKWDKGMCESYREQIDTLLVFAGLFSAVVTAFAVESYQWLQDDPADASVELLRQAVVLLSTLVNQTSSTVPSQRSSALSDAVVVRINVYWFLSLVLSLSAALIGIVCKQWLREYERDIGQSAQQALAVRQMKFDGLDAWGVGAIVTSVPLLLQVALALFFIGISELLWHLHLAVAIAVTTVAGLTGGFYFITASAPLWQYLYLSILSRMRMKWRYDYEHTLPGRGFTLPQCPYKSPQAWLALRLFQPVIDWTIFRYCSSLPQDHHPDSWLAFDAYWTTRRDQQAVETITARALTWTAHALGETHLDAWRLLCARQYLALPEGSMAYRATHTKYRMQLEYQLLSSLEGVTAEQAILRKHVELFCSSWRAEFDVNTSVELFLQLTEMIPFDSRWFFRGLSCIRNSFVHVQPTLHDDMAIELLRVVQDRLGSDHPSLHDSYHASNMLEFTVNILDWAPSRAVFLPAVCAVAATFLRSPTAVDFTPRERADIAYCVLKDLRDSLLPSSTEIGRVRGFGHIVALAQCILDNDPTFIYNGFNRLVFDGLGLSHLHEERITRFPHRSDEDGMYSDRASGRLDTRYIDLLVAGLQPSVVSPDETITLDNGIRLPIYSETAADTALVASTSSGDADDSAAPLLEPPALRDPTAGDTDTVIELRGMAGRGDIDLAARTDHRLGLGESPSPSSSATIEGSGLSYVREERLPRVRHQSDGDGMHLDTVSEHPDTPFTADVQLQLPSLSEGVSTAANSPLVDDTRLLETEIATRAAAAGRGYGDEFLAPRIDAPHRLVGVSVASRLSRPVSEPEIELHDMAARAGDTDDAARADPRLRLEQPNSHEGGSGVTNTSSPPGPHIAIPIETPEMSASLSGFTSTSHDLATQAPSTP